MQEVSKRPQEAVNKETSDTTRFSPAPSEAAMGGIAGVVESDRKSNKGIGAEIIE